MWPLSHRLLLCCPAREVSILWRVMLSSAVSGPTTHAQLLFCLRCQIHHMINSCRLHVTCKFLQQPIHCPDGNVSGTQELWVGAAVCSRQAAVEMTCILSVAWFAVVTQMTRNINRAGALHAQLAHNKSVTSRPKQHS